MRGNAPRAACAEDDALLAEASRLFDRLLLNYRENNDD